MASIGNVSSSLFDSTQNSTTGSAPGTTGSGSNSQTTGASDPLANESTFLQLLVAQLKNQNPMSPMDGTTFVTQLAQFSDLEQNLAMRQDLDGIDNKYTGTSSTPAATSATSGSQPGTQSNQTDQQTQPAATSGIGNSNQTGL
jgi:flagellar basal-body rod modification protein FlgD